MTELPSALEAFRPPLSLRAETPPAWAEAALADPEVLPARLAEVELNHFRHVLDALQKFGWTLRPDRGNA